MKINGRFIVVGTQRSGSSAIVEAVGRHPDIVCGYEWTQRVATWRKIAVGRRALNGDFSVLQEKHRHQLQNTRFDGKSVLGFKRLFRSSDKWILHPRLAPALWADRLEWGWSRIRSDQSWKFAASTTSVKDLRRYTTPL